MGGSESPESRAVVQAGFVLLLLEADYSVWMCISFSQELPRRLGDEANGILFALSAERGAKRATTITAEINELLIQSNGYQKSNGNFVRNVSEQEGTLGALAESITQLKKIFGSLKNESRLTQTGDELFMGRYGEQATVLERSVRKLLKSVAIRLAARPTCISKAMPKCCQLVIFKLIYFNEQLRSNWILHFKRCFEGDFDIGCGECAVPLVPFLLAVVVIYKWSLDSESTVFMKLVETKFRAEN